MSANRKRKSLSQKYPPSQPCSCGVCSAYCERPGWWTVGEAARAMEAGFGGRMMLEMAPEMTFGVLAPAFRGCEASIALQQFAGRGCTFLSDGKCELHGSGYQPLECRFCHHDRKGKGKQCHADLERDWRSDAGRSLVSKWLVEFTKLKVQSAGCP